VGDELEYQVFRTGAGRLSRYISVSIIDCGAGLFTDLHRGILAAAHAQVFVVPATADGALSARAAFDWLGRTDLSPLLSRTVVALVSQTPTPGTDLEQARRMLAADGLPLINVPYDRHLAAGAAISLDRLGTATHTAATRIAAEAFTRSLMGDAT
jgi:MinD-like ATPase involved in chromosome partitioning or flagellar assembly